MTTSGNASNATRIARINNRLFILSSPYLGFEFMYQYEKWLVDFLHIFSLTSLA